MRAKMEGKIRQAQLLADLAASQNEPSIRHLVIVLDNLTDELREDNDTAEETVLYRNQGEIRGYNRLKGYILHGIPTGTAE